MHRIAASLHCEASLYSILNELERYGQGEEEDVPVLHRLAAAEEEPRLSGSWDGSDDGVATRGDGGEDEGVGHILTFFFLRFGRVQVSHVSPFRLGRVGVRPFPLLDSGEADVWK